MPTLEKLQQLETELDQLYSAAMNAPIDFNFVLNIVKYVNFVESSPILAQLIEKENEDLRDLRRRLPKAMNDREYELLGLMLDMKLYMNVSEDFTTLVFSKEALNDYALKTSEDEMFPYQIRMVQSIADLEKGKPKKDNYYFTSNLNHKLNKVQRYLAIELGKLEDQTTKSTTERGVKFDEDTGNLFINGVMVAIKGQKRVTNEYRIMKYIFSSGNLRDEFFYTEIATGILDEDFKLSSYTTACEKIQNKILKETGIGDFLIFNYSKKQGKMQINPKYLS